MATEINNVSGSVIGNVGTGNAAQSGQGATENKAAETQGNPASSRDTVSLTPRPSSCATLRTASPSCPKSTAAASTPSRTPSPTAATKSTPTASPRS